MFHCSDIMKSFHGQAYIDLKISLYMVVLDYLIFQFNLIWDLHLNRLLPTKWPWRFLMLQYLRSPS